MVLTKCSRVVFISIQYSSHTDSKVLKRTHRKQVFYFFNLETHSSSRILRSIRQRAPTNGSSRDTCLFLNFEIKPTALASERKLVRHVLLRLLLRELRKQFRQRLATNGSSRDTCLFLNLEIKSTWGTTTDESEDRATPSVFLNTDINPPADAR